MQSKPRLSEIVKIRYRPEEWEPDYLIWKLNGWELSQWINLVSAGNHLSWPNKKVKCPFCGEDDNVMHAHLTCKMLKNKTSLKKSLDTELELYERVQAVKDVLHQEKQRLEEYSKIKNQLKQQLLGKTIKFTYKLK